MARSRICPRCGHDTVRGGVYVEPVYGMTVVCCASCRGVMPTRVNSGANQWWRGFRRWRDALVVLAVQGACAACALVLVPPAALALSGSLWQFQLDPYSLMVDAVGRNKDLSIRAGEWYSADEWVMIFPVVGLGAFTGMWIGAALGQHRAPRAWATVSGLILVSSGILMLVRWSVRATSSESSASGWIEALNTGLVAALACLIAGAALPLGRAVGLIYLRTRRWYVTRLVRRARRRRQR